MTEHLITSAPPVGTEVWIANPTVDGYCESWYWFDAAIFREWMNRRLLYSSAQAAAAAARRMIDCTVPLVSEPALGTRYYMPYTGPSGPGIIVCTWEDSAGDRSRLERGAVYLTSAGAIAAAQTSIDNRNQQSRRSQ